MIQDIYGKLFQMQMTSIDATSRGISWEVGEKEYSLTGAVGSHLSTKQIKEILSNNQISSLDIQKIHIDKVNYKIHLVLFSGETPAYTYTPEEPVVDPQIGF